MTADAAEPVLGQRACSSTHESAVVAWRGEILSLFLLVVAVIVGSKAYFSLRYEPFQPGADWRISQSEFFHPVMYDGRPLVFAGRALAYGIEDVAVGLWCLMAGICLSRFAQWFWGRVALRGLAYTAAIVAILFQVINIKLFKELREFLRIDLFWLGGGFTPCPAVSQSVGVRSLITLLALPFGVLALHAFGQWAFPRFWRSAARYLCRPAWVMFAASALTFLGFWLRPFFGGQWSDFWRNPHLVFVQSLVERPLSWDETEAAEPPKTSAVAANEKPLKLERPPRNLIVIVLESIGTSYLEPYGSSLPTTPILRRLLPRSLIFDNYYATTNYSFGSSLSLLGGVSGDPLTLSVFAENPWFVVPSAASHLKSHGYQTYFLGAGGEQWWEYLGSREYLLNRGFDVALDPDVPFWSESDHPREFKNQSYGDEAMFQDARRAVASAGESPFALFVWTVDSHAPYRDGDGPDWDVRKFPPIVRGHAERESAFRSYLKAIWRVDRFIGALIKLLETQGILDQTLIAVTGDHGESFGDHGLSAHGNGLFESQVHVPLILIYSGLDSHVGRSPVLGGHLDFWPTIVELFNLPTRADWPGRSLFSGAADGRTAHFYSSRPGNCGMREGPWKYLWDIRYDKHFLFNLANDPEESHNLAELDPQVRDRLHRRVRAWVTAQRQYARRRGDKNAIAVPKAPRS